MAKDIPFAILYKPVFRVIASWVWWFVGAILTILVILVLQGVPISSITSATKIMGEKGYLAVYIEIVSVGLLPVVFSLICKDDFKHYGMSRKGLVKSILLSLLFVAVMFSFAYLSSGKLVSDNRPDFSLGFPWNLWYAMLGIFAWGPLEVFFVIWLITNTDQIFNGGDRVGSWGLVITVIIFGLMHIATTQSVYNAVYTGIIFLVLGLIYKYSRNAIGPMIAWTLINGQVWYIARLL